MGVLLIGMCVLAAGPPSVAVLNMRAEYGIAPGAAKLLTEQLLDHVRHSAAFSRTVGMSEIETALQMDRDRQLLDCSTDSCAAEMAGALGVDMILVGTLGKLGGSYVMGLKLMESKTAAVKASVSRKVSAASEDALLLVLQPLLDALLQEAHLTTPAMTREKSAASPLKTVLRLVGAGGAAGAGAAALSGLVLLISSLGVAVLVRMVYVPVHAGIADSTVRAGFWNGTTAGAAALGAGVLLVAVLLAAAGVTLLVVPGVL